jgi:PEP-CTERM motif-containing protein
MFLPRLLGRGMRNTLPCLAACLSASAQGTFQNLDFESPNAGALTNSLVAFSDAFPGWIGYIGTNQTTCAGFNFTSAGAAAITLITASAPGDGVIGGNYTATIVSGDADPSLVPTPAAIAQGGLIPQAAQSIRFSAFGNVNYLSVTLNGVAVPFTQIGTGPNYATYAGDVSAFAGLTAELRFTEQAALFGPGVLLDDIQFSPSAVPEPGTAALLGISLAFFGLRLRWSERNKRTPVAQRGFWTPQL